MDVFFEKSEKQKCLEVPFRACPGLVSGGFRGNLVVCGNSSVGRALRFQSERWCKVRFLHLRKVKFRSVLNSLPEISG